MTVKFVELVGLTS